MLSGGEEDILKERATQSAVHKFQVHLIWL